MRVVTRPGALAPAPPGCHEAPRTALRRRRDGHVEDGLDAPGVRGPRTATVACRACEPTDTRGRDCSSASVTPRSAISIACARPRRRGAARCRRSDRQVRATAASNSSRSRSPGAAMGVVVPSAAPSALARLAQRFVTGDEQRTRRRHVLRRAVDVERRPLAVLQPRLRRARAVPVRSGGRRGSALRHARWPGSRASHRPPRERWPVAGLRTIGRWPSRSPAPCRRRRSRAG